jgi:hypothetical protein
MTAVHAYACLDTIGAWREQANEEQGEVFHLFTTKQLSNLRFAWKSSRTDSSEGSGEGSLRHRTLLRVGERGANHGTGNRSVLVMTFFLQPMPQDLGRWVH